MIVRVNVVLNRTVVVDSDCKQHCQVTVNNNRPIQDYVHPDDQTQPPFEMTPGFKPFTVLSCFSFCHCTWIVRLVQLGYEQQYDMSRLS